MYACCQNGSFERPNRLFSKCRDGERDRIRIEVVVQRVVADTASRARFRRSPSLRPACVEDVAHLPTEVAFHLKDEAADLAIGITRSPAQQLIDKWIHARRGFAGADGTENHHARVEPTLRDREPRRPGARPAVVRNAPRRARAWERRRSGGT